MTKIIHLAGNSGSGKTALAINLALAMKKRGREVILVDGNIYSPDVAYYLGMTPSIYLNEFLNGERKIDEILTAHSFGITVIPTLAEEEHAPLKHKKINDALLSLIGKSEIVLVDSFSHNQAFFNVIDGADETLFVATDDFPNIVKSRDLIRKMESRGMNVIGIVLNKQIKQNNKKHIQAIVEKPVLCQIPFDKQVIESVNLAKPALLHYPMSSIARAAMELAETLDIDKEEKI
jgi:MinD-like ATPase involved in chromosome partitioning or flagellar assembly